MNAGVVNTFPGQVPEEQPREYDAYSKANENQYRHPIRVEAFTKGFMVEVGCKRFAIEKLDDVITYMTMYLKDPRGTETAYREGKLFIN